MRGQRSAGRRTTALGLAVVLGCLPLAACDGDGGGGSSGGSGGIGGRTEGFEAALDELPQLDDDFLLVSWTDLDAAREANDVEPDDDDYLIRMTGNDDDSVVAARASVFEENGSLGSADDVGFDWLTAETAASVSGSGDAFAWYRSDDDVEPGAALEEVDDDLYGRDSLFVALDGPESAVSRTQDLVAEWRDGDGGSLADDDDVATVAAAIDDEDAVSGAITTLGDDDHLGVGWIDDDGDPAFVIVYALGSDGAADDARDGLEDAYDADDVRDQLDVDEIRTDGSLVVVTGHQVDRVDAPYAMYVNFALPVPD